jgi:nicotinamide-nucleotide amidase
VLEQELVAEAETLLLELRRAGLRLATAESCTGGLIAAVLTEVAGASDVLERGFVTYSNAAKTGMLGVDPGLVEREGAVSAAVARAMCEGALSHSQADVAVAVTGVAGPGGGTDRKPVGLVHLAAGPRGGALLSSECRLGGIGRHGIRVAAVREAFRLIRAAALRPGPSPSRD